MATESRQNERDRIGNNPSAPGTEHLEEDNPLESPAEGEDPDTAAHELQEGEEPPERQEQREAEEHGSGQGAV